MKKLKYVLISLVAVLAFTAFTFSNSTNANAKAKTKYITSFPKSMRGKWYMYTKHLGLTKVIITKKSISEAEHVDTKKPEYRTVPLGKPYSKKYIHFLTYGKSRKEYFSKKHMDLMNYAFESHQANYVKIDGHKWLYYVPRFSLGVPRMGYLNVRKVNKKPILSYFFFTLGTNDHLVGPVHFARTVKEAKKIKKMKFRKYFKYHDRYNNYNDTDYYVIV